MIYSQSSTTLIGVGLVALFFMVVWTVVVSRTATTHSPPDTSASASIVSAHAKMVVQLGNAADMVSEVAKQLNRAERAASRSEPQDGGHASITGDYKGPHSVNYNDVVSWHRNGYLLKKGLLTKTDIKNLTNALEEMRSSPDLPTSKGGWWKYYEVNKKDATKKQVNRIERVADHPYIQLLSNDPRIFGTASALLGGDAVLFKDKANYKLPGGGKFEAHQDIQPHWDVYTMHYVSVLISVDYNLKENGCLEVATGHHARGLVGRYNAALNDTETAGMKWEHVETTPGDVLFFNAYTPHRSADNLSPNPRRNVYLTFTKRTEGDHRERYYADKHNSLPPDADRDPTKNYAYKV